MPTVNNQFFYSGDDYAYEILRNLRDDSREPLTALYNNVIDYVIGAWPPRPGHYTELHVQHIANAYIWVAHMKQVYARWDNSN